MYEQVQTPLCRDLVVHDDKLESKLSTAKLFDQPLFYSFRRDPAARYSIKLQLIQFTARHVEIKKNKNKKILASIENCSKYFQRETLSFSLRTIQNLFRDFIKFFFEPCTQIYWVLEDYTRCFPFKSIYSNILEIVYGILNKN